MAFKRRIFLKALLSITLLSSGLVISSCAHKETEAYKAKQAQIYYKEGLKYFQRGDYEKAAEKFRKAQQYMAYLTPEQIKTLNYDLAVALYKAGKYEDAILELEDFIKFYPSAPQIEQAYVMLIKAYLKISPDAWRDQTYTEKALRLAKKFLQLYPDSPYRPQVEELIFEAKRKLAKHQYLIAKFYEDYGYYYPAAVRFEYLLLTYPDFINYQDVLFHYIKNLYLVPKYARKKEEYFKDLYEELKEKIQKGEVEDKKAAQKRLEFYEQQIQRWEKIAKEAVKKGDENLKIYAQKFGKDKNYQLLLKIKKGEWSQSWVEKLF
jgi:outer membrane protein assembly factor BamD